MAGSGADPNKRLGMLWSEDDVTRPPPGVTGGEYPYPSVAAQRQDPLSILNYIKALNNQRLDTPAVALGALEVLQADADTCVLIRRLEGEAVYIAVNFSATEQRELLIPQRLRLLHALDAAADPSAAQAGGTGTLLSLQPYGILYLGLD